MESAIGYEMQEDTSWNITEALKKAARKNQTSTNKFCFKKSNGKPEFRWSTVMNCIAEVRQWWSFRQQLSDSKIKFESNQLLQNLLK